MLRVGIMKVSRGVEREENGRRRGSYNIHHVTVAYRR